MLLFDAHFIDGYVNIRRLPFASTSAVVLLN